MVVGVAVGLVLGVGIIALIVFFDDRVKSLTALKAAFQEPVIGQVPNVGGDSEGNEKIDLLKEDDDRHNFAESFRNIRSSILFMEAGETRPKTIVITSAIPSEGKSSVAANLAKTMAMAGSKVLLVDGDQRRCSINVKMDLPVGPGFSDVLTGKLSLEEAMLNPFPNLFVLVRGTTIKNPGELFVGSAADNFLRSVYDQFDYILIDTPPVLAADDVTSLAPKVDGVVFVIRADHTSARLAKQSLELLYNRHVRVLGLIYNRANLFLPEYSYYKYSSYYNQPQEKGS
jgi:capsular exopolysaccharide synthesis family protein